MAEFNFDDSKTFDENCLVFLETLESVDREMADILRDNWDALVSVVREGERDTKARCEFNSAVAAALESLVKPSAGLKDAA